MNNKFKFKQAGLSMIEVLIVIAILALLIIAALSQLPQQLDKAKDGKRKSDLQRIKIAFENYYNDEGCYPEQTILDNCGSTDFAPYLKSIPCDPKNEQPYIYYPEEAPSESNCPQNHRVWADLYREDDPQSRELNCGSNTGCGLVIIQSIVDDIGVEEAIEYNYGVSEGVPVSAGGIDTNLTDGYCCQLNPDAPESNDGCDGWSTGSLCVTGPYENTALCGALTNCM